MSNGINGHLLILWPWTCVHVCLVVFGRSFAAHISQGLGRLPMGTSTNATCPQKHLHNRAGQCLSLTRFRKPYTTVAIGNRSSVTVIQ